MTQEEYQYWIEHIRNNHFPLPDVTVKDMPNWRNRSVVARALVRTGDVIPAIELFKSITEVTINGNEEDCAVSEVEDRVWCLKELSILVWHTTGNCSEALKYMEEALTLITTYPQQFNFLDKGEVWNEIKDFIFFMSKGKQSRYKKKVEVF